MSNKKEYTKTYFVDMNIQSAPKPKDKDWFVRIADSSSVPEFTVEDWEFTLDRREDSIGKVEGADPRWNFRRLWLPEPGQYWVSRDFAGQELRILANLANEKTMIKTFLEGGDLHRTTAMTLWGDPNRRKDAKAINFGLVYGKTSSSLADDLGIPEKEAKEYMDKYFEKMPNIKKFLDICERKAAKDKEISNIYGRKRRLKSFITAWGNITNSGARKSYNHPIQSFGAEIIKLALIKVHRNTLTNKEYEGLVYFMSTIHDEINFSVDKDHVEEISYEIGKQMEHKMKGYPVPIVTDLEIGNSMGVLWKFKQDEETLKISPKYIEYWGKD